ncbi:metal ABC transporter ATP-binding protein [Brachybacterium phenoliresistens]|uniref:Zinc ABC transporter ATPase n=1 Tax=Brachybacterium phenoliresistens TaxID=396014 RepID=Z9JWT2_9MICO|nr:metal ABC transporter ATP-binding protein [Brachybacterium phenoliresistens]EWS82634.1 zinc ABC transporter ATPase [Brachybacterium phenoliresistens]
MSRPDDSAPQNPVVDVRKAVVTLGSQRVLHSVDLEVRPGELVALLGANGSGKSTLLRTVVGALGLDSGSARLFGHDVSRHRAHQQLGYVPQHAAESGNIPATARETVATGLLGPRAWFPRARDLRVDALLSDVGLSGLADRPVTAMSGGQRQRVMIARALVRGPSFLVLDEPFSGVDIASRELIAGIFRRLHSRGTTILVVLHDLGELEDDITRAVVLDEGRVIHDGPPSQRPRLDPGHDHELRPVPALGQELDS